MEDMKIVSDDMGDKLVPQDEDHSIFILESVVFGDQDCERCPEDFLYSVEEVDEIYLEDLSEMGLIEELDLNGFYVHKECRDMESGDFYSYHVCTLKRGTEFEDDEVTVECPEWARAD